MNYFYFLLGILIFTDCRKFSNRKEKIKYKPWRYKKIESYNSEFFDEGSTKQDGGGTAAKENFPKKVDASTVVDDAPKIVEDTPKITDDAITIIDEGPTITDDVPAITDDVSPVAETATTTVLAEIPTPPSSIRSVVTYDFSVWCKLQPIHFDCDGRGFTRTGFYYDSQMKRCVSTTYSTCANNFNKFKDSRGCMKVCRGYGNMDLLTENLEVLCRLQPEFGDCYNYFPMFYYDVNEKVCRGFSFSGCGGNTNRFHTLKQCNSSCADVIKYEPDKEIQ